MAKQQESNKKRQRNVEEGKLVIDISLPEPPSKKAKRLEKKKKSKTTTNKPPNPPKQESIHTKETKETPPKKNPSPSIHSIWIANLPFSTTKSTLRTFFASAGITAESITRIHLPTPSKPSNAKNKGFAYVDFTSPAEVEIALSLSETLLSGRKVLVKRASDFTGRPDEGNNKGGDEKRRDAPTSRRLFVGNLGFETTLEDLREYFGTEDCHMATFLDSGKCKGFAWVRVPSVEVAKGFVGGDGGDLLHGRKLRCEYAEDGAVRYVRRFGGGKGGDTKGERKQEGKDEWIEEVDGSKKADEMKKGKGVLNAEQKRAERRKRHDLKVAQKEVQAPSVKRTGAIVQGSGTKIVF
ncbi:hypothetical protein K470DRAFT_260938, partial [Piedraia hortae CBS 480.64]